MTQTPHLQDARPDMPELGRHLLQHYQRRALHERQQAILDQHTPATPEIVTPAGDARKLRGIPAITQAGLPGTQPGTAPGATCHRCNQLRHGGRPCT